MVPPDKCYSVWVSYFKAKKEKKRLERVKASINKIAHKQIICIRYVTAHSKQLHEVMELSMYIAAYRHRRIYSHYIPLFYQQFPRLIA